MYHRGHSPLYCLISIALFVGSPGPASAQDQEFRRGDSNSDGVFDITDPVHTLSHLFLGGGALRCRSAADSNDTGGVDIADAIYSLAYLFLGGPPPPAPFPDCGKDATPDALDCSEFTACGLPPLYVNLQVDAELEDVEGIQRMIDELLGRDIRTTLYVSADYANRNALLISDFYKQGFEIALHGYYTGEQLATMTYEEQLDLLTRAKEAVEGCKPCGVFKPVVGFRPQYFSQNEDTFRVLDEIGIIYNGGFKCHQISLPGHENDDTPYAMEGHDCAAVPLTTIPWKGERIYLCDIACANVQEMSGEEWGQVLQEALDHALETRKPLVALFHGWQTGDMETHDYWQAFLDLLDAAEGKVTFVTTQELVDLYVAD